MDLQFGSLVKNPKRERFYWGGSYWPFNEAADYWERGLEKLNNKRKGEAYQDADRDTGTAASEEVATEDMRRELENGYRKKKQEKEAKTSIT